MLDVKLRNEYDNVFAHPSAGLVYNVLLMKSPFWLHCNISLTMAVNAGRSTWNCTLLWSHCMDVRRFQLSLTNIEYHIYTNDNDSNE